MSRDDSRVRNVDSLTRYPLFLLFFCFNTNHCISNLSLYLSICVLIFLGGGQIQRREMVDSLSVSERDFRGGLVVGLSLSQGRKMVRQE